MKYSTGGGSVSLGLFFADVFIWYVYVSLFYREYLCSFFNASLFVFGLLMSVCFFYLFVQLCWASTFVFVSRFGGGVFCFSVFVCLFLFVCYFMNMFAVELFPTVSFATPQNTPEHELPLMV